MNKFIISGLWLVMIANAYASYGQKTPDATENDITTSQAYVNTALANTQNAIPAKSGDKVVTYTGTKGTIGERDIVTTIGTGNGLTTVGTVKTELANKQAKTRALPATNVVTYTNTNGTVITTPIYNDTVNTFQNGLVRAETLNEAVAAGVRKSLIGVGADGVTPSNTPMFWRVNSNFTDVLPATANLHANIAGTDICYKRLKQSEDYTNTKSSCSSTMYDDMGPGDWGVVFPYDTGVTYSTDCTGNNCGREILGISACAGNIAPSVKPGEIIPQNLWATLDSQYTTSKNTGEPGGIVCYCRVSNPINGPWIKDSVSGAGYCANVCAYRCAHQTQIESSYRTVLFSAVATE